MKNIIKKINKIIETIKIKVRRKYIINTSKKRQKKIKNKNFTIISNNCWGGFVYQSYSLKYNTPTIGMFFMADDYIKFISNIKHYLSIESFEEVLPENSKWYKDLYKKDNFGKYPIAKLDDIELHFLHYKSIYEAQEKWNERKKRVNLSNIIYKFSEMNKFSEKNIIDFQKLKVKNKICFITNKYQKFQNVYTFVVSKSKNDLLSSEEPIGNSKKININEFINNLK